PTLECGRHPNVPTSQLPNSKEPARKSPGRTVSRRECTLSLLPSGPDEVRCACCTGPGLTRAGLKWLRTRVTAVEFFSDNDLYGKSDLRLGPPILRARLGHRHRRRHL